MPAKIITNIVEFIRFSQILLYSTSKWNVFATGKHSFNVQKSCIKTQKENGI
jgi:hypothetical protein